jgi:hypothetical protein
MKAAKQTQKGDGENPKISTTRGRKKLKKGGKPQGRHETYRC